MRIEENFQKTYSPAISVYLDDVKDEDKAEIAGMLRGLMCAIEGWGSISDLTNERFSTDSPVRLPFKSVENAHYFESCVKYFFADDILESLKVKKRVYRA